MSDAEQAKGQVAEARRFASKFDLNNITVVIDYTFLYGNFLLSLLHQQLCTQI